MARSPSALVAVRDERQRRDARRQRPAADQRAASGVPGAALALAT